MNFNFKEAAEAAYKKWNEQLDDVRANSCPVIRPYRLEDGRWAWSAEVAAHAAWDQYAGEGYLNVKYYHQDGEIFPVE